MCRLLLVTGPPGAGKSATARILVERFSPSVLVEGDAFFSFLRRGALTPWTAEAHEQNRVVVEAAAAAAGRYVSGGYTAIYDGVVGPWFLRAFAMATGLASLDYAILLPPVERCLARVATRRGHGFTDGGATRQLHRDFATARIARRHVLGEPAGDATAVAAAVERAVRQGVLAYDTRRPPSG